MNDSLTLTSTCFARLAEVAISLERGFPGTPVAIVQDGVTPPTWTLSVGQHALNGWTWPQPHHCELVIARLARERR